MSRKAILSLFAMVLALAGSAFGQGDRGTVTGLAVDSSAAAVVGAEIAIVNDATNLTLRTVANETGNYRFVGVPIGIYTLRGTSEGFQTYERREVQVQTNQTTVIDLQFEVGAVTETITVTGSAIPLIATESSEVGLVVESKRFLELPLTLGGSIRNPSSFIRLSPGVSGTSTWRKSVSGGGAFQDMVYYDGIALSRGDLSNDAEVNPSVDAIAEFKLITNNYSAEYSHALGGVTSFTMKSGTNTLHGTGFHFIRNDKLDARGFFGSRKAPVRQNEWGGTIGGPLIVPGYNGANRTFWFFSWDQFYRRGGQLTGLNTLPTARMLQGDFGELPRTIFDPATSRELPDGAFARDPFPGAIIPQDRWSRVTSVMLPYHPEPELPGVTANSVAPLSSNFQDHRHGGAKGDHIFNDRHRMSLTFNFTDRPAQKSPGPSRMRPIGDTTALENYNIQRVTTRVLHFNFDSTISPTTLNHIGLGFSRFRNPNFSQSLDQGWTQPNGGMLGLTGLQFDLFPTIRFDTGGYTRYGDHIASDNYFNTFTALETLTLIRGSHTIKIGAEWQYHQDNFRRSGNGGGDFRFRRNGTGDPASLGNTGDAWASFLLGEVHNARAFFKATDPSGRYTNWGFFIDDSWKVNAALTLNFGLRWEIISPHADRAGRLSYVDINQPNAEAGGLPGVLVFGGPDGFGTRMLDILWRNPAPRFGFAYRVADQTVIRGGVGIFNSNYINQGLGLPSTGFAQTVDFRTGNNGVTPAFNWDNGFPQDFLPPPNFSPFQLNGLNALTVLPADYSLPYKIQWNFTIERQFGDDLGVSASYVANAGRHLYERQQINQIPDSATRLPANVLRSRVTSDIAKQNGITEPFDGFAALWGGRGTVAQALRPYPQFGSVGIYGSTYANSSYNSFQLKVDKRYKGGLSGTVAYTWSKFLSDGRMFDSGFAPAQDSYLREWSYHPSDRPQVLTFSYLYELPLGSGKKWLTDLQGAANLILGGWQIAGVHSYQSGTRLNVTTNNTLPYFNGSLRPDIVSSTIRSNVSMSSFDPARDRYLQRDAFNNPAPGQYGNAPRFLRGVRGPAFLEESFALFKNTAINERWTHQLRLEITNPMNRVVFGNPVLNLASGNFGRITRTQVNPRQIQFGMKLIF